MHAALLFVHGLWRWSVLLLLITVVADVLRALMLRSDDTRDIRKHLRWLILSVDVQALLGVALYVLSPTVRLAWNNPGAAMKTMELRFFLVEHPTAMFLALALAHAAPAISRRGKTPRAEQLRVLECVLIVALLVSIGIPWWRPLLRF